MRQCGVCAGDVNERSCSGYGVHSGSVIVRRWLYADYTVLLSPSCYWFQKLLGICENFANTSNIKLRNMSKWVSHRLC